MECQQYSFMIFLFKNQCNIHLFSCLSIDFDFSRWFKRFKKWIYQSNIRDNNRLFFHTYKNLKKIITYIFCTNYIKILCLRKHFDKETEESNNYFNIGTKTKNKFWKIHLIYKYIKSIFHLKNVHFKLKKP